MPANELQECKLASEKRWSEFKLELQQLRDDLKATKDELNRQGKVLSDIQQLSTSVSILANNMKSMLDEITKQGKRIEKLEQKPAKRWEGAVGKVIDMLIGAAVTYFLIKAGLQ